MSNIYVGDIGTIILLDTETDLSSATTKEIRVRRPDRTVTTWSTDISIEDSTKVKYIIQDGDLSIPGWYKVQAYIEFDDWQGYGDIAEFEVKALS